MENKLYIKSYVSIENGQISIDGNVVFESSASNVSDFLKEGLRHFGIQYPKFFKMDNLSKLAFLGSELLLKDQDSPETALLFANSSSSLDTDVTYQESIADKDNYFPSPAVFVYTLPNICLGEISIRHQLKTENSFFIFGAFNPDFFIGYAENLIETGKAENVLCGWTELFKEDYKAFLYLVSDEGKTEHTKQNIELFYTN
ncbi:3-oxoacyl-ACP synthase [Flavobacterium sp. MAH-1]|uniref:3-oxoacyl-ACP synthase n=1 Tax=Flavobacterium agri TaxID=2743471 RepID=A0A7Y8Y2J5_9FLAO|nr:3-oxoacyl-ACP synthase [Flavobacterium agri]NUY81385.1 3-oxoacyl-ACP synthase [Flavobacterium agri]NYA71409.1 3-oxoacyl-ACP synthase [Flavobacterium agri]